MGVYPDELRDPLGQRGQVPVWIAQFGRDRLVSRLARVRCDKAPAIRAVEQASTCEIRCAATPATARSSSRRGD